MRPIINTLRTFLYLLLAVWLTTGILPATAGAAGPIYAGDTNAALGFTYGTNGQDVTNGENYYYVENSLAKAIISRKIGANNAQGTFQKGWLADFVLKDSAKKETLDWSEMILSNTIEAGWGFGTRDIDLGSISVVNGEKIVAAGKWLTDPSIAVTATYRMIPDAPIVKITVHLENNSATDFNGYFEYLLDPDGASAQNSYVPGLGWDVLLKTSGWTSNYIYSGAKTTTTGFPAHGIAWKSDNVPVALNAQNYICGVWFNAAVKAGASRDITFYHITAYPSATPAAVNQGIADWASQIASLDQETAVPTAPISGQVIDPVTGLGVSGVKVIAKDINANTMATRFTSATGGYQMLLPVGTYTLTASRLAYQFASQSTEVGSLDPVTVNFSLAPVTAWAGTGKTLSGSLVEGTETDIVLENSKLTMSIAKTFNDPQLSGATMGKPVDMSVQGLTDGIDWLNLPYMSLTQPTGTEAWAILKVANTSVNIIESSADQAVVQTTGTYTEVPGVGVVTTYTIEPNEPWVFAESIFTNNSGSDLNVWAGDALDNDDGTQISHVPGIGDITAAYANPAPFTPNAPWIGQYGNAAQAFGIIYEGDFAQGFSAYGNGSWIQSQKQITIPNGSSYRLSRFLVVNSTTGFAQKIDAVSDVYSQLVAARLGVTADMSVAPASGIVIGNTVTVSLPISNSTDTAVDGVTANIQLPGVLTASSPLAVTLPTLAPHSTQTVTWVLSATAGGAGFVTASVQHNGQSIFSRSSKLFVNGPGWYAGDNHGHSKYSDGTGTISENFTSARNKGLSFLTATDHNTINQQNDVALENREDFVALFGDEVSNGLGHCLAYNITSAPSSSLPQQTIIDNVKAQNSGKGLLFVAHPYYPGLEWDDWTVTNYDGIEVWNGFYAPKHAVNAQAFTKWDDYNRQGRHLVGIANSDAHNSGKISDPRIKTYLPALSQANIYDALKKGTLYGTNGPDIQLTVNGKMMGSNLSLPPSGSSVSIALGGSYAPGLVAARLLKNGSVIQSWTLAATSMAQTVSDNAVPGDFYRFEIDGASSGFAFSNPVWINGYNDISSQVSVATSGFVYSRSTKLYSGTMTVTNTSSSTITGPFVLWLNNLTGGVTLTNGNGSFNGYPHIDPAAPTALNPGQSFSVPLKFSNPANAKINFTPVTMH